MGSATQWCRIRSLRRNTDSSDQSSSERTATVGSVLWPARPVRCCFGRLSEGSVMSRHGRYSSWTRSLAQFVLLSASVFFATPAPGQTVEFVRGDSNSDSTVDLADALTTLEALFAGGSALPCARAADTNDDGTVNLGDPISLLQYLFSGAAPPPAPFPTCGLDPTPDDLTCSILPPCATAIAPCDLMYPNLTYVFTTGEMTG